MAAPAPMPSNRPATYDDVLSAPENMVAEILDGELLLSPRPAMKHARTMGFLYYRLYGALDPDEGGGQRDPEDRWWFVIEPELHLSGHVIVPDLAAWRTTTLPTIPDVPAFELRPDWLCEVLTAATRTRDRVQKLHIYARQGVPWVWLLDPDIRILESFHLQAGQWLRTGAWSHHDEVRSAPFPHLSFPLTDLWPDTPAGE